MFTAAQLTANQANAKLSTGPKTPEGKTISSQNSFRHGCTGKFMLLPQESYEEFQELKDALFAQHQPANPTEHILVERLIEHFWLSQRALRLQATAFEEGLSWVDEKKLALYLRYQTTHDRAFHKCLATLQQLRRIPTTRNPLSPSTDDHAQSPLSQAQQGACAEVTLPPSRQAPELTQPSGFVSQTSSPRRPMQAEPCKIDPLQLAKYKSHLTEAAKVA